MELIINFVSNTLVYFVVAATVIIVYLTPRFIDLFKWLMAYTDGKTDYNSTNKNSKSFFSLMNFKIVKKNNIIYPLKDNDDVNETKGLTEKEQLYKEVFNSEIVPDKKYSLEYMRMLSFVKDLHNDNVTYWISEKSLGKKSTFGSNMSIDLEFKDHHTGIFYGSHLSRSIYEKDPDEMDFKLSVVGCRKIKYEHLCQLLELLISTTSISQLHDKLQPTFTQIETILIMIQYIKQKYPCVQFIERPEYHHWPLYSIGDVDPKIFGNNVVYFDIWGNPHFTVDMGILNCRHHTYSSLCKKYEKLIQEEQTKKDQIKRDEQLKNNEEERNKENISGSYILE